MTTAQEFIPAIVLVDRDGDTSAEVSDSGVQEESFWHPFRDGAAKAATLDIDPQKLQTSLDDISGKLERVLANQAADEATRSFALDSFEVGLAISASGGFAMIAEVGIEASVKVVFKRK
jgi:hypothetical protein